jgi:hypothetical protein
MNTNKLNLQPPIISMFQFFHYSFPFINKNKEYVRFGYIIIIILHNDGTMDQIIERVYWYRYVVEKKDYWWFLNISQKKHINTNKISIQVSNY